MENNKKLNSIIKNKNNETGENKYKDLFIRPNNSGLLNHLKKENEKLRRLIISYELKNKKIKYELDKEKVNDFEISKFNFKISKKPKEIKEKKDINKIISKDYKYDYSNKTIETSKRNKNIARLKKPEVKKIKDINLFDNDLSFMKAKEDLYKKYNNTQVYNNNTFKERSNNSSSQRRNRNLLNINDHNTINSSTMRVRNVIINKSINNYILKPIPNNLSSNGSRSKIIKKRKIYDNSFINNSNIRTIENRKNFNSSLDKNCLFKNFNYKQKNNQNIKKVKKKENNIKEIYYQKPIINKITIYNNINNNSNGFSHSNYIKQKMLLNEKIGKKQIINKYDNNFNI